MNIKVDKILLDSPLAAGMIGGVSGADPVLAGNLEVISVTAISIAQGRFDSPSGGGMTSTQTTGQPLEVAATDCDGNVVSTDDQRLVVGCGWVAIAAIG